jgi:hypothetical protein
MIMKKWLWLILLMLVTTIALMGSTSFFPHPETLPIVETTPKQQPQPQPQNKNTNTLLVSADRLLAHIRKLNFQRYTPKERSHRARYITNELQKSGWKPQIEKLPTGVNIFAQKQGKDKGAGAILIAAHYDTVDLSPGADY